MANEKEVILEAELKAWLNSQAEEVARLKAELESLKSQRGSSSTSATSLEVKAVREELAEARANLQSLKRAHEVTRSNTQAAFDKVAGQVNPMLQERAEREAEKIGKDEKPKRWFPLDFGPLFGDKDK